MLKKNSAGYVPPAGVDSSLIDDVNSTLVDSSERNAQFNSRADSGGLRSAARSSPAKSSPVGYQEQDEMHVGYSNDDRESFENAYDLMKDFPQWVALLKQNPYLGFTAPESIWDMVGLSNRAKDKLAAMRAAYRQYNSDVVLKFMSWYNSLPQQQRTQAVQAGYNPDTLDVQPSSISDESIQPTSNPFDIASDNSGEQLMNSFNLALSSISQGVRGASALISLVQNVRTQTVTRDKIAADTEEQQLKNYLAAYNLAKTIYSESAAPPQEVSKDGEISPSFKFALNGAPHSVNELLNQFQNTRGFDNLLKKSVVESTAIKADQTNAETAATIADRDSILAGMSLDQTTVLFGSPRLWKNLHKKYNQALNLQLDNINAFLELYDPLSAANVQNKLNSYMNSYYAQLDSFAAADAQNEYVRQFSHTLKYNAEVLRQRKMALELRGEYMNERFVYATLPDTNPFYAPLRTYAQTAIMGTVMADDAFGMNEMQGVTGSGASVNAFSVPAFPSMQLPNLQPK